MESKVKKFYRDKIIFLTGALGLIGHLTIEKLLRCCDVKRIYVLIRHKRNQTPEQRINRMFENELFDKLRSLRPDFKNKVVVIDGDCDLEGLGLLESHRNELCQNVNIVFHAAAMVKLDEKFLNLVRTNVKGTKAVIELCHQMKHLKSFVYVSTAFSNSNRKEEIEERVYEPKVSGSLSVKLLEGMNEDTFNNIGRIMTSGFPNSYQASKHLAEDLVQEEASKFSTAIFRPGSVIQTFYEPVAGWINNFYGPVGVWCQIMTGALRVMQYDRNVGILMIPADFCTNALLAAAWEIAESASKVLKVYNVVPPMENDFLLGETFKMCVDVARKYPLKSAIWYPAYGGVKWEVTYKLHVFFFHFLTGIFFDTLFFVTKTKFRVLSVRRTFQKLNALFKTFTLNQLKFKSDNLTGLWGKMEPADREWLNFDMFNLNTRESLRNSFIGMRYHVMKDRPESLALARKRMKILKIIHWFSVTMIGVFVAFLFSILFKWN